MAPKFRVVRFPGWTAFCVQRRVLFFFKVTEFETYRECDTFLQFETEELAQAYIDRQLKRLQEERTARARRRADRGWFGGWQP